MNTYCDGLGYLSTGDHCPCFDGEDVVERWVCCWCDARNEDHLTPTAAAGAAAERTAKRTTR
jgi:hypothetical protein